MVYKNIEDFMDFVCETRCVPKNTILVAKEERKLERQIINKKSDKAIRQYIKRCTGIHYER